MYSFLVTRSVSHLNFAASTLRTSYKRYDELKREIHELSTGKYYITSFEKAHLTHISSVDKLKSGDELLSVFSIEADAKEALNQIKNIKFLESVDAYIKAVKRGVNVTLFCVFRDREREVLLYMEFRKYLEELDKELNLRIILKRHEFNLVFFNQRKVLVFQTEVDCKDSVNAKVYVDSETVSRYSGKCEELRQSSYSLEEALKLVTR